MKDQKKTREAAFIARCRKDFGHLTFEAEMMLRYAYSTGFLEGDQVGYTDGHDDQVARVKNAIEGGEKYLRE